MSPQRLVFAGLLGVAILVLALVVRPERASSAADEAELGITVTGIGSVEAVPDEATFTFRVVTRGASAKDALAANAGRADAIIAALKQAGVRASDIRTDTVSVSPRYYDEREQLRGYVAENGVSARLESGRAGEIVDATVAAGATDVSGPTFARSDRKQLYRLALRKALQDARQKAQAIASAGGVAVGDVVRAVEGGEADQPPYEAAAALRTASTPIEPGRQEIEAELTVTFAVG